MPMTGVPRRARRRAQLLAQGRRGRAALERGDQAGEGASRRFVDAPNRCQRGRRLRREVDVAAHHHLADHSGEAHALAVLGAVDALDAVGVQLGDLARHDDAAAAAEDADVRAAARLQQVDHVLEVLDVAALVRADRDALHVLLQRRGDDLVDRAVVAEVDHLGAHPLQDAPHDVDRRVVAVEQARRGDEAHLVARPVVGEGLVVGGKLGHRDASDDLDRGQRGSPGG
jgi:hypothetical protein